MANPHDRRKFPRKEVPEIVKVFDMNTGDHMGSLVNISPGGVLLVTHLDLRVNTVYQLRICIPEPYREPEPITFGAEVLWIEQSTNPNQQWVGIQIIDVSDQMRSRIARLTNDKA
jgi:PilZ domain